MEEKCGQFAGIDTAVQNRMVLIVPHCRGYIDAVSQEEIDGKGLGNNLHRKIVFSEKCPWLNLKDGPP